VELAEGALSTACSYCGAKLVDAERAATSVDRVAPFRIERTVALQRMKEFLAGRPWAPTAVRRAAVDARGMRGVLVPFWCHQGRADCVYEGRVGIYWYRTVTTRVNGKTVTRVQRETEWFGVDGTAAYTVEDHLASASRGLPEAESNALEPFDLGYAQAFDARLLSGFEAELPSISAEEAAGVVAEEVRAACERRVEAELLPGDAREVSRLQASVRIDRREAVLLPVWIATFRHAGKVHRLLVNGQSGKCIGDVPVSAAKVVAAVVAGLAVVLVVVWLAGGLR
jgi:hypothetical protein